MRVRLRQVSVGSRGLSPLYPVSVFAGASRIGRDLFAPSAIDPLKYQNLLRLRGPSRAPPIAKPFRSPTKTCGENTRCLRTGQRELRAILAINGGRRKMGSNRFCTSKRAGEHFLPSQNNDLNH